MVFITGIPGSPCLGSRGPGRRRALRRRAAASALKRSPRRTRIRMAQEGPKVSLLLLLAALDVCANGSQTTPLWRGPAAAPLPRSNVPLGKSHPTSTDAARDTPAAVHGAESQSTGGTPSGIPQRVLEPLGWPCCRCASVAVTTSSLESAANLGRMTGCELCGKRTPLFCASYHTP